MDLTYLKTLLGFVSNRTHDTTTSILAYWEVLEYFQELSFLTEGIFWSIIKSE